DPLVPRAVHQRGDHMLEDHPVRYPPPMTAQRMAGRNERTLRQQRRELDPQGLQQANWQDRHGTSTAEMACTSTVAGARACRLLLFSYLPIVGRSKFSSQISRWHTWGLANCLDATYPRLTSQRGY